MTVHSRVHPRSIEGAFKALGAFFMVWGTAWLATGSFLGAVASIKLHKPDFLAECVLLTFGRVYPAYLNALIYGWGSNAIFGLGLWIMGRLCKSPIPQRYKGVLWVAGFFWNVGVVLGIGSILLGNMTSLELLEMPAWVTPFLLFAYALIGVWGVVAFRYRTLDTVYVSQWYLFGALFWFPWMYSTAQVMGVLAPARGVVQAIVGTWFAHNVVLLWLAPMGFAVAYYLIPKMRGQPVRHYSLTTLGFWAFAFLAGWTGTASLNGGPIPVWVSSVGVAASVLLLLPVLIIVLNYHLTLRSGYGQVLSQPGGGFVVLGIGALSLFGLAIPVMALPEVSAVLELTYVRDAHFFLGVYGFFTLTFLGATEFILISQIKPEIKDSRRWAGFWRKVHFVLTALGVMLVTVGLSGAGWIQGSAMEMLDGDGQPIYALPSIGAHTQSWLQWSSIGWVLLAFGQMILFLRVLMTVRFIQR